MSNCKFVDFLLNSWIGKGLTSILKFINRLIPKRDDQILFESITSFSDNPMQLYNYIKSLNEGYRLYWIVDELREDIDAPQYKRNTIGELWQFLRSKYIVTSHGHHIFFRAKNQVYVNVWHGMPLKAMGYAQKSNPKILPPNFNDNNYYLIATSIIMMNALAACFNQDPRRIFVTGQPRNDKLFKGQGKILEILKIDPVNYNKIVLFAPTFRKSDFMDDGQLISYKFNLPDFDRKRFQEFLEENEILFLVKFHPLEEKKAMKYFKSAKNIKLIKTETLQEKLLDLHNILPCADILVTDYSSVYFDFLLLDRPIIFIVPDLEEYRKKRGFILEPFEFWTPGPKVKNFKKFLEEIKKSIKDPDYYSQERRTINNLINYHKDDKSTERIYKLVFKD